MSPQGFVYYLIMQGGESRSPVQALGRLRRQRAHAVTQRESDTRNARIYPRAEGSDRPTRTIRCFARYLLHPEAAERYSPSRKWGALHHGQKPKDGHSRYPKRRSSARPVKRVPRTSPPCSTSLVMPDPQASVRGYTYVEAALIAIGWRPLHFSEARARAPTDRHYARPGQASFTRAEPQTRCLTRRKASRLSGVEGTTFFMGRLSWQRAS